MEALKCFVSVCQPKSANLKDCENHDFSDITLTELLYVPMLFITSFALTVYWILRNRSGYLTRDETHERPLPTVNGSGDSIPREEEPLEEPWEYLEDYPSPY